VNRVGLADDLAAPVIGPGGDQVLDRRPTRLAALDQALAGVVVAAGRRESSTTDE
jgi:hypothetical protein